MNFVNIADMVNPETGKTYREENYALAHKIPVGTLVEVKFDSWFGRGCCWKVHARLFVYAHTRDCDGTPLYSLSRWKPGELPHLQTDKHHGFGEDALTIVEVTPELIEGHGALEWGEDEK